MHAVILAGGKGTRLRPYTTILPKPLMPIGEMPILEVVLRQLKAAGFNKVTLAVGFLAELLQAFFGNGEKLGVEIVYSFEDKPLGTVGPLKKIGDLPDCFLVMNGDILTDIDYRELFNFHMEKKAKLTIATYKRKVNVEYGVLNINSDNFLTKYVEKPTLDYTVSMGIYVFNRDVLQYVPKDGYFDLPQLVQKLLKQGEKVASFPFEGYWLDIGRNDDYAIAIEDFEKKRHELLPSGDK